MIRNYLIANYDPEVTMAKAVSKNVNPHTRNIMQIFNPRRTFRGSGKVWWLSIVVDEDGYVLLTDWLTAEQATVRFVTHPETTIEL